MRLALISGITSGTFGSMRKADELSTTTAPAFTAMGVNFLEMPPPAENSAISTPSNEFSESSSITTFCPRKSIVEPADTKCALVHGGDEFGTDGAGHAGNGNNGIVLHFGLHQAIKKPRTFSGGASVQMMRSSSYARKSPEARQGFAVFAVRLVFVIMARAYAGDFDCSQRVSDGKSASTRLNRTSLLRNKLTYEPSQSFRSR